MNTQNSNKNCANCKNWFLNPHVEYGDLTKAEGRCLVSDTFTRSDNVCNAWELSLLYEQRSDRIAELERKVEQYRISLDDLFNQFSDFAYQLNNYDNTISTIVDTIHLMNITVEKLARINNILNKKENEMTETVKRCPFCGKEPQGTVRRIHGDNPHNETRYSCVSPKCPHHTAEAVTLEEWNKRLIEDELNKEIEELKELCAWALESSLRYLNAWEEEIKRSADNK